MNLSPVLVCLVIISMFAGCNKVSTSSDSPDFSRTDYPSPVIAPSSDGPTFLISVFSLAEFNDLSSELTVWSENNPIYDKLLDTESKAYKVSSGVEIDLMNCAGYLGSGKVQVIAEAGDDNEAPQWALKLHRGTIASDAVEKIKRCQMTSNEKSTDKMFLNRAFAISPRIGNRSQIKIGEIDVQKLFTSLPNEFKQNILMTGKPEDNLSEKKLNLNNGSWTDSNGDGVVDLVVVDDSRDGGRSSILVKDKDGWREFLKFP